MLAKIYKWKTRNRPTRYIAAAAILLHFGTVYDTMWKYNLYLWVRWVGQCLAHNVINVVSTYSVCIVWFAIKISQASSTLRNFWVYTNGRCEKCKIQQGLIQVTTPFCKFALYNHLPLCSSSLMMMMLMMKVRDCQWQLVFGQCSGQEHHGGGSTHNAGGQHFWTLASQSRVWSCRWSVEINSFCFYSTENCQRYVPELANSSSSYLLTWMPLIDS